MRRLRCAAAVVMALGVWCGVSGADVVVLNADRDATIFEDNTSNANGAGVYFHVGNNSGGNARRGLIRFNVSSIPAGSTITAVSLALRVDDGGNSGPSETVALRRLTQDWSEGPTNPGGGGGSGAAAVAGDVTWTRRIYNTTSWTNAGGTFSGTTSASLSVSSTAGVKTWATTAQLVADVQGWLNTPSTNFGWLLLGNEATNQTARRFSSRQNATSSERPKLTVTFTPPAGTGACCELGVCTVVTQASCTGGGGTYQGNGTACAPNPCPQPTGGCCFGNGTCTSGQTQEQCDNAGGNYRGNGTTCIPACPVLTGGCCLVNATCVVVSEANCDAQNGSYNGDNTACAGVTCPWVLVPFQDPLPIPSVAVPDSGAPGDVASYTIDMVQFSHQFHASLPMTTVWGYEGQYPGPTFEARRGRPVEVTWRNDLRHHNILGMPLRNTHVLNIDQCLHGPDVTGRDPVTVVHLHGAHLAPESDGIPDLAFRPGQQSPVYQYPNNQQAATLWYHDHALGLTRLNVYMGLAGFYLLRDDAELSLNLPRGHNEIPLVIQDRSFTSTGALRYNDTFTDHFFGDFITVNGKVWPYLEVRQGKYRFRLLNGSNTRSYTLSMGQGSAPITFHQIGTDLGLLPAPVPMTSLTLMPGERADIVVDFSGFSVLTRPITMRNSAVSPFPGGGDGPDITNVMQFRFTADPGDTDPLPPSLVPVPPINPATAVQTRQFQLQKTFDNICGHDMWLINSLMWSDITEFPVLGTTEIWEWVNRSGVSHPMHVHLVQFQVLNRQDFTVGPGDTIVPTAGTETPPGANEQGWKDTVQATPNQITRVIMRFLDHPGTFPYHCHILDHEDHEMMRQFTVVCPSFTATASPSDPVVRRGQTLTIDAVTNAVGPATYQWRRTDPDVTFVDGPTGNGSTVSGATAAAFTYTNIQFADAGRHGVFVTDTCGVTNVSSSAFITVLCAADFNLSGSVTVQDLFDFLAAYFGNQMSADINNSGGLSVQDIFDFLALYFGPC
ncbi:MAG: multicopper oxidase family protein [Phycisphaerales bacterium]|nr:multicopper oxidase family protein [Phycisphaerales bacterium]